MVASSSREPDDSPFQFPCAFPIKAMGRNDEHFDAHVVEIVQRFAPPLSEGAVTLRPSATGKYLAVTVTINAQSRDQLDRIYQALNASERVLMAL